MHTTAIQDAQIFYDKYIGSNTPAGSMGILNVLDVGSMDVKGQAKKLGSLREIFGRHKFTGIDIGDGPNVDIVYDGKRIPFNDGVFNVILSTSCLEHDPRFWRTFAEMARVLKEGGLLYINAPSAGHVHRFPLDCFRFFPDAWVGLAEDNGLTIVEQYINQDCYWKNNVVILKK